MLRRNGKLTYMVRSEPPPTLLEHSRQTLRRRRRTLRRLGVRRLALFGSARRPGRRRPRDLDFLVEFDRKSFDAYMETKERLEEWFGRPVDLVISDAIKPALRERIPGEAVTLLDHTHASAATTNSTAGCGRAIPARSVGPPCPTRARRVDQRRAQRPDATGSDTGSKGSHNSDCS